MSSTINLLEHDHTILTKILQTRRAVPVETMKVGEQIAWRMYLVTLADTLNTVDSLIDHLRQGTNEDEQISS